MDNEDRFFPIGALSFFGFLTGFYIFLWLLIYALLLSFS